MNLGSCNEIVENKLILLYIVDKIKIPINNLQFTKIITENNFMNYFIFQQVLTELCESKYLLCEKLEGKSVYSISKSGSEVLKYFINKIPIGLKKRIDNLAALLRKRVKNEINIIADYIQEAENIYYVNCKAQENDFVLMEVKLMVGSKNDARVICDNWKKHSQAIYPEIINSLLKLK